MGPEADKYRLSVSGYSGDAGDAYAAAVNPNRIVNGMQFSTPDQDNDLFSGQCSMGNHGGWFRKCERSTLNKVGKGGWNAVTDDSTKDVTDARMMVKLD